LNQIDIVLPVHNEAEGIARTLTEFYAAQAARGIAVRFILCEDGSTDDTLNVIRALSLKLPIRLISSSKRKGYSRAVIDGLEAAESSVVACLDSDGQYDPHDFQKLLSAINGQDLVIGLRSPRADSRSRRWMSGAFAVLYKRLFPVTVQDPSCSFLLVRRKALHQILSGKVGVLTQGFWWEFMARATLLRLKICEVPVRHLARASGTTRVYLPLRLPRIALTHLKGLFALRAELK